jgi:ABC-type sugar transport system ATPase subunit
MPDAFIEFEHITKTFAGVTALDDVSLSIARGECHALMGENGAGKSTLGKVLAGIHRPDSGTVAIDGQKVSIRSPADAGRYGIGMVHQELAFCPDLSVAENLCMGKYPRTFGLLSRSKMRRRAEELLAKIGVAHLDVRQSMRVLSTAQEQLVQIASAVGTGAKILIFDEPTSSLSEPEAQALFRLIEELQSRGVTIIYVSHRMPEVFRLCDRVSILRDGRYVGTIENPAKSKAGRDVALSEYKATEDEVIRMMIGRSVEAYFPQHLSGAAGDVLLSVRNLTSPGKFADVSFDLRRGEILGFAGLVGSGRSEIAKAVFGLDPDATGEVTLDGERMPLHSIRTAMRRGVGLVPEDRKRQGLVLMMGGRQNLSLANLDRMQRLGLLDQSTERRETEEYFGKLAVKTPSIRTPVAGLSGGNQQKVALAKWLARGCKLLIIDEPTRGVDVGAKAAIHGIIDELAREGIAIWLISSELPEVINLSTRVLVMRNGRVAAEVPREAASQEHLMRLMAGAGAA